MLICTYPPLKIAMANTTHKRSSKKSSAKTPAKRRTSPASKTKKLSKAVRKTGNGKTAAKKAAAKKAADEERYLEKGNAHLLKAWQIMYEIRTGKRKAKPPSLKWLKSLMMRTSI